MYDILCIGDSTHDTFVDIDEASILCDIKPNKCLICLSWADKIPANKVTQVPGVGNSANASIGASRLGLKTAIYTHIGDDITGKNIIDVFKKEKVKDRFIKIEKGKQSNYSVVLNYGAERTIIVMHEKWKYNLPKNISTKWIYCTSLGPNHRKLHKQLRDFVEKKNIKLVFQPGTHQLRDEKYELYKMICSSYILILNKEEAVFVLGKKNISPKVSKSVMKKRVKSLLSELYELGPSIVVITDGRDGAYAYDGETYYYVKSYPPKAKERTGAGDSFSIAFVSALIKGKSIEQALLWGNANSTSVVQYIGAREGLLTENQIYRMIRKYKNIKPVKI